MKENVLIDTDVLLDFFFGREPFATYSSQVLNLCKKEEINGFCTPVIIANTYYLLRKTAKHEFVVDKLNQLIKIIDVLEMNRSVVLNALNSDFKDFEDALQNFSAIDKTGVQTIITRNVKDFKKSDLAVLTPETFVKGRYAS